jgi:hypothetical protein
MVVQNTTAYTWDWYFHLVGDRASLWLQKVLLHWSYQCCKNFVTVAWSWAIDI